MFSQITILGTGLLGGSLIKAIKRHNLCKTVAAWSPNITTRNQCKELSECDVVFGTSNEAVKDADLVILCPPVDAIIPLLQDISSYLKPGALVTDVGSTKAEICTAAQRVIHGNTIFVGSHPMAGSEKRGLANALADLFTGKCCFVTPFPKADQDAVQKITQFWQGLEMPVFSVSPHIHDTIVANVSHLPHLLASVLASYLQTQDPDWTKYAGKGLRDTTRIAAGDPRLWLSIVSQNHDAILHALEHFQKELHRLHNALTEKDDDALLKLLQDGKSYRDQLG